MIVITFTPSNPKAPKLNGLLLRREGMMVEVAWDSAYERPASVGWINILKQGGIKMLTVKTMNWHDNALRMMSSGDVEAGKKLIRVQEVQRMAERVRKESSV